MMIPNDAVAVREVGRELLKVTQIVDENGFALIYENDMPKYVVRTYAPELEGETADDENIMRIGEEIVKHHLEAFKGLVD